MHISLTVMQLEQLLTIASEKEAIAALSKAVNISAIITKQAAYKTHGNRMAINKALLADDIKTVWKGKREYVIRESLELWMQKDYLTGVINN